jgi:hypothetical protein
MLSSRNFHGQPRKYAWKWNEFGKVKWRLWSDQELWAVGQVDYLCVKRGIGQRGIDMFKGYVTEDVNNHDWLKLLDM